MLPLTLAALLLGIGCTDPAPPATPRPISGTPLLRATSEAVLTAAPGTMDPLPPLVRKALRDKMARHGDDTTTLLHTTLRLDYPNTDKVITAMLEEGSLARPVPGDPSLVNASVPERFFDMQDEMHVAARALRDAARKNDEEGAATAFGALATSCVRCHAVYLAPTEPEEPTGGGR